MGKVRKIMAVLKTITDLLSAHAFICMFEIFCSLFHKSDFHWIFGFASKEKPTVVFDNKLNSCVSLGKEKMYTVTGNGGEWIQGGGRAETELSVIDIKGNHPLGERCCGQSDVYCWFIVTNCFRSGRLTQVHPGDLVLWSFSPNQRHNAGWISIRF